eukprot:5182533-Lingulodinium_polyedra.AAC.1
MGVARQQTLEGREKREGVAEPPQLGEEQSKRGGKRGGQAAQGRGGGREEKVALAVQAGKEPQAP